jgi:hypothetical protein
VMRSAAAPVTQSAHCASLSGNQIIQRSMIFLQNTRYR